VHVYWTDMDGNGRTDFFLSYTKDGGKYPLYSLDEMAQIIPKYMSKKYTNYASFMGQTMEDIFGDKLKDNQMFANEFSHLLLINSGGIFSVTPLPFETQKGPIYGMQCIDVNNDGFLDVVFNGNNKYNREQHGPDDAHNGGVLLNDKGIGFNYLNGVKSGLNLPGDGRGMILSQFKNSTRVISAENSALVKVFEVNSETKAISIPKNTIDAIVNLKNGSKRKVNLFQGGGYMSAMPQQIIVDKNVKSISFREKGKETWRIMDISF